MLKTEPATRTMLVFVTVEDFIINMLVIHPKPWLSSTKLKSQHNMLKLP